MIEERDNPSQRADERAIFDTEPRRAYATWSAFDTEIAGARAIAQPKGTSRLAARLREGELTVAEALEEIAARHVAIVPEDLRAGLDEIVRTHFAKDPGGRERSRYARTIELASRERPAISCRSEVPTS